MVDELIIYISAAPDLNHERDMLGRLIAEVPVTLGWRIVQSSTQGNPVNIEAIRTANIHLLLLGSDIRAPIGLEWLIARQSHRTPVLLLKQGILRTPAANDFVRRVGDQDTWQTFKSSADLYNKVQLLIAEHLLSHTNLYAIKGDEKARLQEWFKELETHPEIAVDESQGGAGESGVIISPERYVPREGVLLKPRQDDTQVD